MYVARRAAAFTGQRQHIGSSSYIRSLSTGAALSFGRCRGKRRASMRVVWSPLRGAWRRLRAQSFTRQCVTVGAGTLLGFGGYVTLCILVGLQQAQAVAALFQPHEDYPLEEWSQVERTLREGDIVLMMGTGVTSWKITTAQFVYSLMQPAALRYSHVAVVVEPAQLERWPLRPMSSTTATVEKAEYGYAAVTPLSSSSSSSSSSTAAASTTIADILRDERSMLQRKQKRGAIIMEVVDNVDVNAADVNGKVRHECVQVLEANRRLFGRDGERWCYSRFAVRRLKGFEWTPQRKRLLRTFINENVGRPLDKSPLLMTSFIHPRLYEWTGARRRGTEISCAEMIVDLYKFCGVIQRRVRMVPAPADSAGHGEGDVDIGHDGSCSRPQWYYSRPSIQTAPYHFAEGMEVGVLDFADGISLGPEVRMSLPGGQRGAQ
ncbi:hypothetical protein DQ04_04981040 [Trypanosoma grayi]|uniref:hypothetical protein n=1 Tax=Trypanosoma grayi TaxID=71804 RepID=UPI0004F41960|nr:hypothetical protein DQ04_04981040 [Trypanosoma grayi]KEG09590.1 hypothetical protein DQ04_04981040 [Trypanosoma grayi]